MFDVVTFFVFSDHMLIMNDLIILGTISNEIKRFSSMFKYNDVALTILFNSSVVNIVVVVAICVALLFAFSLVAHSLLKFLSQLINIIKRLFF